MIKSGETIRLDIVQEKLERLRIEIDLVESQLSFVQGDEIHDTGADSCAHEIKQIKLNLKPLAQWVENALITMTEVDFEAEQRRLQRNA